MNEDPQYGYPRPHSQAFQGTSNQTQTISPQALQHYPTSFPHDAQHLQQVSSFFNQRILLQHGLDANSLH